MVISCYQLSFTDEESLNLIGGEGSLLKQSPTREPFSLQTKCVKCELNVHSHCGPDRELETTMHDDSYLWERFTFHRIQSKTHKGAFYKIGFKIASLSSFFGSFL